MSVHVPMPPPPPSPEVVELSEFLKQVIQAYQSDHPEVTTADVQAALRLSTPSGTRQQLAAAMAIAGLLTLVMSGLVLLKSLKGGTSVADGSWAPIVLGIGGAIVVVAAIAVSRNRK
jgi:hypothetical protein